MTTRSLVGNTTTGTRSLFLDTLRGERRDRVPVWMMRQAGRYLPEYRRLKERHTFWDLASDADLATEVTLQPVRRYALDAAVIFTDIMVPACFMGVEVDFTPGPVIEPLRCERDIDALRVPEVDEIAPFLAGAIRRTAAATSVPVIGHAGAPLTFCAYLVTGKKSTDHVEFRTWLHDHPALAHRLLRIASQVAVVSLRMQVQAGASVVQLFDSWVGVQDQATYAEFGRPYVERVMADLADLAVPRVYYTPAATHLFGLMSGLPVEAFGLDWRTTLSSASDHLGARCVQGNLDPAVLLAGGEVVRRQTHRILADARDLAHVFNVGAGVLPATPVDALSQAIDAVHEFNDRSEG